MQKPSSVTSGNIAPAIAGPYKDTKEVYVIGGMVLILAIVVGAAWLYSQNLVDSSATGLNPELANNQVSTLLKSQSATSPAPEPFAKTVATGASVPTNNIIHADIYFEVGRKGLTDEAKSILATQAEILKKNADWGLLVQGYTDQQGSASYNKQLGLKRADTVKEELMKAGVAENQIKVVSLGKEGVLCIDNSDVCRHMNRHVHLEMRKIGQEHMVVPTAATQTQESLLSTGYPEDIDPALPPIDEASGS
ncbi:MAG: OmpA family protein [Nitrospira sp.]|nr:OmpA family protein [Nitrospira sp.]